MEAMPSVNFLRRSATMTVWIADLNLRRALKSFMRPRLSSMLFSSRPAASICPIDCRQVQKKKEKRTKKNRQAFLKEKFNNQILQIKDGIFPH